MSRNSGTAGFVISVLSGALAFLLTLYGVHLCITRVLQMSAELSAILLIAVAFVGIPAILVGFEHLYDKKFGYGEAGTKKPTGDASTGKGLVPRIILLSNLAAIVPGWGVLYLFNEREFAGVCLIAIGNGASLLLASMWRRWLRLREGGKKPDAQ